jgi:hypothetical protein
MAHVEYSLLRPELMLRLLPLVLGVTASMLLAYGTARLLTSRVGRLRLRLDNRGTTELEFAIALPVFLISVLTTAQAALMLNAHLVVDYAAFCAARSASVWVPRDLRGEAAHTLASTDPNSSEKMRRVHMAATLAAIPISPRATTFRFGLIPRLPGTDADATTIGRLARAIHQNEQAGIAYGQLALDLMNKWPYAYWATEVSLLNAGGTPVRQFTSSEPVTAQVTHKFEMAVPFAGPVLGAALGKRYLGWIGGYYVPITASYALMLWPQ